MQSLHREYSGIRVDVNEFEWRVLVPELRDRARFLRNLFEDLKAICRDPELPPYLAGPLAAAVGPGFGGPAGVRKYLTQTEQMIETNYIQQLDGILTTPPISDVPALARFLQKMHFVADSIVRSKDVLFQFHFQRQLQIRNKSTGEVVVGPPEEFEMILSYFRIALDQLVRSAEATEATIKHWKDQADAAKKPFLEFVAASTNAATSRRTIVIQMLAIGLALSLSTFFMTVRDPFALRKENRELRLQVEETARLLEKASVELAGFRGQQSPPALPSSPSPSSATRKPGAAVP